MKRFSVLAAALLMPAMAWAASGLPPNTTTATVLIANYDADSNFLGWGSGFFVDEGIVVTNKHVLQAGAWHRVYATTSEEAVNMECFKNITKSDVKLNLDDDVAYMRVYLNCEHGIMNFTHDPETDDPLFVMGYPYRENAEESLKLSVTTGRVLGKETDGWMFTDAYMDFGNSGGPVVDGVNVLGVAVAKSTDDQGNFVAGYFIPSSVILDGLLYANDSRFGYTPRSLASSSRRSSLSSSSSSSSVSSRSIPPSSRMTSSSRSSVSGLQQRTCVRAERYRTDPNVFRRLNERLFNRFGFRC